MTPQDNIRWYWEDLIGRERVFLLAELYNTLKDWEKEMFLEEIKMELWKK